MATCAMRMVTSLFFMSLHSQVVYVSTCAEMYCCVTVYHLSYEKAGYCMWEKCTCDHMYHVDSQAQEHHVTFEFDDFVVSDWL